MKYDNNYYEGEHISCDVSYKEDNINEIITDVHIKNIIRENFYFCTINEYIKIYIDTIKENVIRKLKNLNEVKFITFIFDKNKVKHRMILSLFDIVCNLLQIQKLDVCKTIFVQIQYYNKIVFRGDIGFDGLI